MRKVNARRFAVLLVAVIAVQIYAIRQQRGQWGAALHRLDDGVLRVAVVGDSVAHGAGDESGRGIARNLERLLTTPHDIVNLGINGARTWNVTALLRQQAARSAVGACDAVVISIGGNDLFGDSLARLTTLLAPAHAMSRTIDRIGQIVATIHHLNPATRIVLLGLYDPYRTPWLDEQVARWDARLIERFAGDRAVDVVRIADVVELSPIDRFHPGARGYEAIAVRVAPALTRAAMPSPRTPASAAPSWPARTRTRT